ncbi:high-affinity iron transporter [Brumicola blandensis]|uniref:High-affinity iron transporter n=1 Tax=Brumicola blandensis TaxID=3075611 RepID=A0AAW8R5Z7_9ALTE|nr:high-affinity iron transporter [Alteromonas sp. W409]MDT0583889.1 high-affinity iron transporter [Alteromonas sp. W409]
MLINSLLLLIEEALPISIAYAYLCSFFHYQVNHHTSKNHKITFLLNVTIVLSLLLGLAFSSIRPTLTNMVEGQAYELALVLFIALFILFVFGGLIASTARISLALLSASLVCIVIPHASDFFVFMQSVFNIDTSTEIYTGILIGLGICFSFSYLLYFFCTRVLNHSTFKILLSLFLAAQIAGALTILEQIGLISSSLPLWDSNFLISESQEYGQLLKTIFGYDATPSIEYIAVLAVSIVLTSVFIFKLIPPQQERKS